MQNANSFLNLVEINGVDKKLWDWDTFYNPLGRSLKSSGKKVSTNEAHT